MPRLIALLLSLFMLVVASAAIAAPAKPAPEPILVFAAASLQGSLDNVAAAWTKRSGQQVKISYAGSAALAKQIAQGAPADVFVSADEQWMDTLQAQGAIDPVTRFDLVGNRLVLIAPADGGPRTVALTQRGLTEALGNGRLAMAETTTVPAGRYGRAALTTLDLWTTVSAHLAESDNVRGALAFVARGEAPLGIVYATDARAEPRVRVVATFPARTHPRIVYPASRVRTADARRSAGFLAYLRGREAQAAFARAGFTAP
jgi:molybdate transport system substrate-binding protein